MSGVCKETFRCQKQVGERKNGWGGKKAGGAFEKYFDPVIADVVGHEW